MKSLMLATVFAVFGTVTLSAQTTPQRTDTARPDTTRNSRTMKDNHMNGNNWDKSKKDTANWKNKDATKSDRKMKNKNK